MNTFVKEIMETPTGGRQTRKPTPQLSERKKKLFKSQETEDTGNEADDDSDTLLAGIRPLRSTRQNEQWQGAPNSKHLDLLLCGANKRNSISFLTNEIEENNSDDEQENVRHSPHLCHQKITSSSPETNKENDNKMGANMQTPAKRLVEQRDVIVKESSDEAESDPDVRAAIRGIKRLPTPSKCEDSTQVKRPKTTPSKYEDSTQVKGPKTELVINTKSFYSHGNTTKTTSSIAVGSNRYTSMWSMTKKISPNRRYMKAKQHKKQCKVRKTAMNQMPKLLPVSIDRILNQIHNEKLIKLIENKRKEREQIEKVHDIFRNAKNPIQMARPLSVIDMIQNDSNNNNNNNCTPDNNYRENKTVHSESIDFSDIGSNSESESESEQNTSHGDDNEQIIPIVDHNTRNDKENRKFFKSGCRTKTKMQVIITKNIRANVYNGKITLAKPRKPKCIKVKSNVANEFFAEQATVDDILKNLDDTTYGDIPNTELKDANATQVQAANMVVEQRSVQQQQEQLQQQQEHQQQQQQLCNTMLTESIDPYAIYRQRLPYNTNDPKLLEQQELLLDFLITNNICNEENFKIFIADPDNPENKAAAGHIVDEIVEVVHDLESAFRQRLPFKTNDPEIITQQEYFLDFLIKNGICTEENFDIFIANFEQRHTEAAQILEAMNAGQNLSKIPREIVANVAASQELPTNNNIQTPEITPLMQQTTNNTMMGPHVPAQKFYPIFTERLKPIQCEKSVRRKPASKLWQGGVGNNQYQLDLGQKQFGAGQCKLCGLVYTLHEPEEEKLHQDYHTALHILRFKGWIDEDIVAVYPEWGKDGRIIRLTDNSPIKRCMRLVEIMKIVNKELGLSNYIMPQTFVAYFAVLKCQIVGVCLVQPLSKAARYIHKDDVDYCTEEEFDVKCGISRIWVTPLHRRKRIGSKLIQAAQNSTIYGEVIALDMLAFSAPTNDGRLFAQKLTKTENFLVYQ